jgi:hypothetical protein
VAQIRSINIVSKRLQSCFINACKSLERIHVKTVLEKLHIDTCERIYLLDIPQTPGSFHLGSDLQHGLGSAVDSQSTDSIYAKHNNETGYPLNSVGLVLKAMTFSTITTTIHQLGI